MASRWGFGHFFAASAAVHLLLAFLSAFVVALPPITVPQVVKVTILADAVPMANEDFQYGKIMELPEPKKAMALEKPAKAEVLSSIDARSRGRKKGASAALPKHSATQDFKTAEHRDERRKHRQTTELKTPVPEVRATDKLNPFSDLELANASHEKGGAETPLQADKLSKTEREDQASQKTLSGEEIDRFASANPARELETQSEIVIPFNTRRFEYLAYFAGLRSAVESEWYYPDVAMEKGMGGKAVVRFTLDKSGKLEEAKVIASAGFAPLDAAALDAVKRSAPFKPFPDNLQKQKIHIVATFSYRPQYGKVP
ncbi:MAG: energy transducer TonB [Nitrospinae bacterium]|nr:energy transducer TonB [Nitrospinota bacterium]